MKNTIKIKNIEYRFVKTGKIPALASRASYGFQENKA